MKSHNLNYQLFNQNCNSKFLLLCDHATNRIPKHISKTQLGLTDEQLGQHIAFDLGAKGTAIELSKNLSAPLITSNFSRLVIDPNRSLFINLSYEKVISEANILNYDYIGDSYSISFSRSFKLN